MKNKIQTMALMMLLPFSTAFAGMEKVVLPDDIQWIKTGETEISYLWKDIDGNSGVLLKLPEGFDGGIVQNDGDFMALVVSGSAEYFHSAGENKKELVVNSYFGDEVESSHYIEAKEDILLYISSKNGFEIN